MLSDILDSSINRVFGGVSAILTHQIKYLREYNEDVGEIKCSEWHCIIVEIFFVIDTKAKLSNGKNTDQSLRKENDKTYKWLFKTTLQINCSGCSCV